MKFNAPVSGATKIGPKKGLHKLFTFAKWRIIQGMNRVPEISKAAFLALINLRVSRRAVNCEHRVIDGTCRLVVHFDNGDREIFRGLKAA